MSANTPKPLVSINSLSSIFRGFCSVIFAVSALIPCSNTTAQTTYQIDFETDQDGNPMTAGVTDLRVVNPYNELFGTASGVHLSTNSPSNRPLNLYDSEGTGGADTDLERSHGGTGDWDGGNLTATVLGQPEGYILENLLIINTNTNISVPNDHGSGGTLTLNFDIALSSFGFEFVDLDSGLNATLVFTNTATSNSQSISFADFEQGSGSIHETPNVLFGDRHANRVLGIEASELGLAQFDKVDFVMTSSGGIGTVEFQTVPEPSSAILLLFAGFYLLSARRPRTQPQAR
ncbi:MAG: PEP-CTERM sorting domain-containing protein [Verrucomicrobiales bacterium]|nr:PEP-CTERM sorting domain-containing protein [Verrucomicrobiales bacterium]